MKPLTMELTKGSQRQFQSLGWKTPAQGDCRRQFYALDDNGKFIVLTLKPAMPGWYQPGSKAVFSGEPFPEAVCIEISPCRLLPPPCYDSPDAFESQTAWEGAADEILGTHETAGETTVLFRTKGRARFSDAELHREWAKEAGEDLDNMRRARSALRRWLKTHTGTHSNSIDMAARQRRLEIAPPDFGRNPGLNQQFQEACGMVRWRACFADSAGSVVFLADCDIREELTAAELDEVRVLQDAETGQRCQIVTLEDARKRLARTGKKAITNKWLKTLCERAGVAFHFPMSERQLERVRAQQQSQNRAQARIAVKNLPKRR